MNKLLARELGVLCLLTAALSFSVVIGARLAMIGAELPTITVDNVAAGGVMIKGATVTSPHETAFRVEVPPSPKAEETPESSFQPSQTVYAQERLPWTIAPN